MFLPERDYVTFGYFCRRSVCLSSVVCLSFVTFVRPTQAVEIFGSVYTPLYSLYPLISMQNFTEIVL